MRCLCEKVKRSALGSRGEGHDLGDDGEGDFGGVFCADVEADGAVDLLDESEGHAAHGEQVAALAVGAAAAEGADVEGGRCCARGGDGGFPVVVVEDEDDSGADVDEGGVEVVGIGQVLDAGDGG